MRRTEPSWVGSTTVRIFLRGERIADRRPGGEEALALKRCLDRHEEVVVQQAEEDVSLHPALELEEDRAFGERAIFVSRPIETRSCACSEMGAPFEGGETGQAARSRQHSKCAPPSR